MIYRLSDTPVLETDRLILRAPHGGDAAGIADYFMSQRSQYTGGPVAADVAWRYAATEIGHWAIRGFGMFAVTEKGGDDTCLGVVGAWFPEGWPEREVGWLLWPAAEGKGYGFEAARAALGYVLNDLGWDSAVSYIDRNNDRSVALAKRLGAQLDPTAVAPEDKEDFVYRHTLATLSEAAR